MGVGGQRHAPTALPPRKDPVRIVREAGWVPGPVWTGSDYLAPTDIRSPDRPACTECAIPAFNSCKLARNENSRVKGAIKKLLSKRSIL